MRRTSESIKNRMTLLSALQIVLGLLLAPAVAFPAAVTLEWDPSSSAAVAGYKVYYQADSGEAPFQGAGAAEGSAPVDVAKNLSATLNGLDPASSYFFAVTAYNEAGEESGYSNVIERPEALPPVVAISSPAQGSAVGGAVTVAAAASDNKGVARVEFYVNGALKATDTEAPYSYAWDTSPLAAGDYTLAVKAFDAAGNAGEAAISLAVSGDTVNPEVSLSEPGNNSTVTGNVNLTATASDNVALSRIEFLADGTLLFGSNQSPANYSWNSLPEPNGNHLLTVRAYDLAGNVGESLVVVTVANDHAAPAVSLLSPAPGASLGNTTSAGAVVEVAAAASDDIGVARVEFYLDGLLQRTVTAPPYSFTFDTASVSNGGHTLSARAHDRVGNSGDSAEVVVTVVNDSLAPVVSIANPLQNSTIAGKAAVSATAGDDLGVEKVEIYLDGALKASFSAAPYSLTLDTWQLANGAHTLTARGYDAAGNSGESSVTVTVFNDHLAPSVTSFSMPSAKNSATVEVTAFTASDDAAVTGYLITESSSVPLLDAAGWSAAAPASFTFSAPGIRTAYAWARDAAGHVSPASSATVTVDTVLPVISSMTFLDGASSVTVKASGTDNIAVARMQLYVNDVLQLETKESSLSYFCAPNYGSPQKVTVKVYDVAGNTRSRSMRISKL